MPTKNKVYRNIADFYRLRSECEAVAEAYQKLRQAVPAPTTPWWDPYQ